MLSARVAIPALVLFAAGCGPPPGDGARALTPDPVTFATTVYPILLRDCAFAGCHGSPERFFRVPGPGRARLRPDHDVHAPATAEELALAYARAASMLLAEEGVRRAPLLRKPLAVEAGGARHGGEDAWGANVYRSKRDPSWEALFFWAITAEAAP